MSKSRAPAIDVVGASVAYPVYSARTRSLKDRVLRSIGGRIDPFQGSVQALSNIDVRLQPGDRIALIGDNGAGKSTLLRLLAGILEPTSGHVAIQGTVTSLLDMSMGLDPDATGYENIVMRSLCLGATFAEAKARTAGIEEFSELGSYLDLPLRTYSTGMGMRLSFAIATAFQPEILVLDEMIGTGDAAFAEKARARMLELIGNVHILVLASHDASLLSALCNKALLLEQGRIAARGSVEDVLAIYRAGGSKAVPEGVSVGSS